ncbi:Fe-only nitrogenase subunit delta [Rhodovulum sp. MB263]|uniref:Fe-only nitrogenase subunit delta n=1 Tax=Rhodovulum sp. (strain MB263) TaxID=308754 RepID=UPI0009B7D006|nr:Fe-only nitrogenase subunit delta [Rhodovulum sp. MB263]ARC90139.1 Fe-only nitrogenase subunit delta [Rhodovulum sp. MB263]
METLNERLDPLVDYIMKTCLWQFNSRGWDRLRQSAGILGQTCQILCGEEPVHETALDRCYWVDAVMLARAFRTRFPWIDDLSKDEIRTLMTALHEKIDHLTVHGSLNEELTVPHY